MGLEWIDRVVEALRRAEIRVQRGFPAEKMPYLTSEVVGVSLEEAQSGSVTVAVRIYGPMNRGGACCEELAQKVAQALLPLGASCRLGGCQFDGKTGLFCLPVQAQFVWAQPLTGVQVLIDGQSLACVVAVHTDIGGSMIRYADQEEGTWYFARKDHHWKVQLEDILPEGVLPQEEEQEFTLQIHTSNEKIRYERCCWESYSTQHIAGGIRRVRVAATCTKPVMEAE